MVLNDRTADRESHAHAVGFGGVERLKDPTDLVGVKTGPRVLNRDLHLVRINAACRDGQLAVTYTYAIPPLAILIGSVALDEALTAWLVLGGALVVGGIALAQRTSRAHERRPARGVPSPSYRG